MNYTKCVLFLLLLFSFTSCHKITTEEKSEKVTVSKLGGSTDINNINLSDYFTEDEIKAIKLIYNNGENKEIVTRLIQEEVLTKFELLKLKKENDELKIKANAANEEYLEIKKSSDNKEIIKLYETRSIITLSNFLESENILNRAMLDDMQQLYKNIFGSSKGILR